MEATKLMSTVLYFVLVVVLWQILVPFFGIPMYLLPTPLDVGETIVTHAGILWNHTCTTLYEMALGFLSGAGGGILLAIAIFHSKKLQATLLPSIIALQSVPKSALAPLMVAWFGIGIFSKVVMAFLASFFPMVINTMRGLKEIEPDLLDLLSVLKASPSQILMKVRLPLSLPYVFSGLKISLPMALVGAVIAEFVAAKSGLGNLIMYASSYMLTPLVFAALIILTIISTILYQLIVILEKLLIK